MYVLRYEIYIQADKLSGKLRECRQYNLDGKIMKFLRRGKDAFLKGRLQRKL